MPLALWFSPWDWTHFGPFSFQLSRPLHYLVYFFAGYAIGTTDLDRGLLATDGLLARRWALWTVVSLVGFGLWAGPTSLMLDDDNTAPLFVQIAAALGYSLACAAGCLFLLAVCLRFGRNRMRALDSLSANAYGMYLVHYVFVVWLQFALLELALFAVVKVAIVFGGTLLMSWAISASSGGLSFGASLVGAKR
jgi:surface polysaccharide O-acyltransferase-like enzyme